MNKRTLIVSALVVLAVVVTTNAYAGDGSGWTDFWNGVGSFVHNAMPWNWGKSS